MKTSTAAIAAAIGVLVAVTIIAIWSGCRDPRAVEAFSGGKEVVVQYFRMDGCPHCEKFDGVWSKLTDSGAILIPGLRFEKHDAGSEKAKEYGIRAFPHIQMVVDGEAQVYEGGRSKEEIEKFIRESS